MHNNDFANRNERNWGELDSGTTAIWMLPGIRFERSGTQHGHLFCTNEYWKIVNIRISPPFGCCSIHHFLRKSLWSRKPVLYDCWGDYHKFSCLQHFCSSSDDGQIGPEGVRSQQNHIPSTNLELVYNDGRYHKTTAGRIWALSTLSSSS